MLLTGTALAVRRGGGVAVVLTAAAKIASFLAPRPRRRLGLKSVNMRGGRRRLMSLARRVAAPVCPHAGAVVAVGGLQRAAIWAWLECTGIVLRAELRLPRFGSVH